MKSLDSAVGALVALALVLEALEAAPGEANRCSQGLLFREFVHDALRVVVARIHEYGALVVQLGEHELGRRTAAGLRDVDQPAVALDDAQVLESPTILPPF